MVLLGALLGTHHPLPRFQSPAITRSLHPRLLSWAPAPSGHLSLEGLQGSPTQQAPNVSTGLTNCSFLEKGITGLQVPRSGAWSPLRPHSPVLLTVHTHCPVRPQQFYLQNTPQPQPLCWASLPEYIYICKIMTRTWGVGKMGSVH